MGVVGKKRMRFDSKSEDSNRVKKDFSRILPCKLGMCRDRCLSTEQYTGIYVPDMTKLWM